MISSYRKTAAVAVFAVSAMVLAGVGTAGAQQSDDAARKLAFEKQALEAEMQALQAEMETQQVRRQAVEQQRRAEALGRALVSAQEMEMRMRPAFRLGGFSRSRSGSLAGHVLAAAGDLGLTEAQQQTIRDTQRSHRREEIRRDADVEIAELELEEMMEADTLDLDAIESHMRQIANLQVDERMANLRLDRSVREVLTAEQVDKLEELSPERVIFETYQRQRNR